VSKARRTTFFRVRFGRNGSRPAPDPPGYIPNMGPMRRAVDQGARPRGILAARCRWGRLRRLASTPREPSSRPWTRRFGALCWAWAAHPRAFSGTHPDRRLQTRGAQRERSQTTDTSRARSSFGPSRRAYTAAMWPKYPDFAACEMPASSRGRSRRARGWRRCSRERRQSAARATSPDRRGAKRRPASAQG
jgi:hypothetical protein